ncbi:MAG: endonuclease III [Thermoplasmata archaeon]
MKAGFDHGKMVKRLRERFEVGAFPGKKPDSPEVPNSPPFEVLIATILSQRTKDVNTHKASKDLFQRFPNPKELAEAPLDEVKDLIYITGFYNVKAERIKEVAGIIHEEYDDRVPEDIDLLLELPGVGRKTANCVLVYGFGEAAIPVDTHVHRISNRLGMADADTPEKTEQQLEETMPRRYWIEINKLMVEFGKSICRPRKPKCNMCPLTDMCSYYSEVYLNENR